MNARSPERALVTLQKYTKCYRTRTAFNDLIDEKFLKKIDYNEKVDTSINFFLFSLVEKRFGRFSG